LCNFIKPSEGNKGISGWTGVNMIHVTPYCVIQTNELFETVIEMENQYRSSKMYNKLNVNQSIQKDINM
jgi:hypothetical protein